MSIKNFLSTPICMGTCKVRNEIETKRNVTNKKKTNQTKRNETKPIETKCNEKK